ncbi:MAG: hypothetical protein K2X35_09720 [Bryobacteraceae bacterium]|nr:hypothetical protein [Bryobacteraceae bacterium]
MENYKDTTATETGRREGIGGRVEDMAERMREQTMEASSRLSGLANRTKEGVKDGVNAATDYVRSKDVSEMGQDLMSLMRRYPAQSMAVALLLGVWAGRSMRNRNNSSYYNS